jgi:predicted nucleotidyltransferase
MFTRLALLLQRVIVRMERGPLRPVWASLYAVVTSVVAAYLRHGQPGAGVYVCRSLAIDEPVYGLSDIDLVVVISGDPRHPEREHKRLKRRWERLCRAVPPLGELLPDVAFYEDMALREAVSGSIFTYGLEPAGSHLTRDRAAFFGAAPPPDDFGLRSRPGIYGPMRDWRLVGGTDRRPTVGPPDRQDRRIAAWLELQFWWSFAFGVAVDPARPWSALLCVKLIAEPARLWLSLVEGEEIHDRRGVLECGLRRLPQEEAAFRGALELYDALGRCPRPPLVETLPAFVRLSSQVASRLYQEVGDAGVTDVRLIWGAPSELVLSRDDVTAAAERSPPPGLIPLVDWRALAVPSLPDECFALVQGSADDPSVLSALARSGRSGPYPVLRTEDMLILPALGVWDRAFLRAVQCQATDPVSFALAEGRSVASFPNVPGWCADHWARRGVAEHRAWLEDPCAAEASRRREWLDGRGDAAPPPLRALAKLFTAARAALFQDSIEAGDPELRLTIAAVADRLAEQGRGTRTIVDSAVQSYRAGLNDGLVPAGETVASLRQLVAALPAYARYHGAHPLAAGRG